MNRSSIESLTTATPAYATLSLNQKIFSGLGFVGLFLGVLGSTGSGISPGWGLFLALSFISIGVLGYAYDQYKIQPTPNNYTWNRRLTHRGFWAWIAALAISGFYILLYFFPYALGLSENGNSGLIALFDPLSMWIKSRPASQWFVYGVLYTLAILVFGIKFLLKYKGNRYQQLRTWSVMFFQLCFAFIIPEILEGLNQPSMDLKNMWPLNYYFFFDWNLDKLIEGGTLGLFMLGWGLALILIISPILTYLYGKRWYCSWVCGCGALAETAGDPFRHLSDKSVKAWKIERWLVHGVLVFVLIMTFLVW